MVYFGKFMSWQGVKCPTKERSDLFSLVGKQKKIALLIAGHPVHKNDKWYPHNWKHFMQIYYSIKS
jgi:hypothetical protein